MISNKIQTILDKMSVEDKKILEDEFERQQRNNDTLNKLNDAWIKKHNMLVDAHESFVKYVKFNPWSDKNE